MKIVRAAAAALALTMGLAGVSAPPAKAGGDGAVVAAGIAGFALGAAFPFIAGYSYNPGGYWYVRDPAYYRYPVAYYQWYAPAGGYVYVGPNWRTWYRYRGAVQPMPPYFATPPQRYVYYPPSPYRGYPLPRAGGYR